MKRILLRAILLFAVTPTHDLYPDVEQTSSCTSKTDNQLCKEKPKIAILGAGMAGIAAAHRLQELGYSDLIIIEGNNRIGGRIFTVKFGNYSLEQGALWIHGLGENPVYQMAKDNNIKTIPTDYDDFTIRDENGNDLTSERESILRKFKEATDRAISLGMDLDNDISWRAGFQMVGWRPKTSVEDAIEYFRRDFEFLFHPEAVSLKHAVAKTYDIHGDDQDLAVADSRGYTHIAEALVQKVKENSNLEVHLEKYVVGIVQETDKVVIKTKDESEYVADYAVGTFPLGVLQNRLVDFDPPLPNEKVRAIDQLLYGIYYEIFLEFPEKFWDDTQFVLYASNRRGYYTVWQNINRLYPYSNILHVTITENEARRIDRLSDEEIKAEVIQVLNNMYGNSGKQIPEPIRFQTHRWLSDPLFIGSFSIPPPGYTEDMCMDMCKPFGHIYFAGEACSFNHSGFVQGAWYSGIDAANHLHNDIS